MPPCISFVSCTDPLQGWKWYRWTCCSIHSRSPSRKLWLSDDLRIWAIAHVLISAPFIYFIRPRSPSPPVVRHPFYGIGFIRMSAFWILQMGLAVESLGYFIPSIYLPTFAESFGLSSTIGTLLLALINGPAVISTVTMGMLIDRFHVTTVTLMSTLEATISVFLFWGFSTALPMLFVCSVLYGFFAVGLSVRMPVLSSISKHSTKTPMSAC